MLKLESEEKQETKFNPPLWRQRRTFVSKYLKIYPEIKKVCDAGCGEGALLEILLNDTQFNLLAGVDIHEPAVIECYNRCKPNDMDMKYLRELPITLELFHGSLADTDARLQSYNCFVLLEVIEHMDEKTLDNLPKNLFGFYRPEHIIISTPNAEFNVYFPDLKYGTDDQVFRHWDHKFEWTRKEFQSWCKKCADEYGYDVEFDGVGLLGPADHGYCTQIAIFSNPEPKTQDTLPLTYNFKYQVEYPYFEQDDFSDVDIEDEILDNLYMIITDWDEFKANPIIQFEHIWSILRIRQVCKYKKRLTLVIENSRSMRLDGNCVEILVGLEKPREICVESDQSKVESQDDDWGNGYEHTQGGWGYKENRNDEWNSNSDLEYNQDGWDEENEEWSSGSQSGEPTQDWKANSETVGNTISSNQNRD
ncbi:Small RNA 2'-O-methyltransferase [Terramyces sp. JEL0728]|nr:Small RNA 2'-O-methyltransferase [Terramyces sp. JEL0728]